MGSTSMSTNFRYDGSNSKESVEPGWHRPSFAPERGVAKSSGARAEWHVFPKENGGGARPAGSIQPSQPRNASPLEVVDAQWTYGDIAQSSPYPGVENVIRITFSANVPLGPAQDKNTPTAACWLQFSGLQLYAPEDKTTAVKIEGSVGEILAPSADSDTRREGVWVEDGAMRAYLRRALAPHKRYTVGIVVQNPTLAPVEVPKVAIEANGCVVVRSTQLPLSQQALAIRPPCFQVAKIGKSSVFPGTTNRLTVTFSTTVALEAPDGAGSLSLIISGLTGSPTPNSDELPIEVEGEAPEDLPKVLADKGVWRQAAGTLEVPLIAPTTPGSLYTFAFSLVNPSSSQPAQGARIQVSGGLAVETQALQVYSSQAHSGTEGRRVATATPMGHMLSDTEGELDTGWYHTFSGHLRSQYPHLYMHHAPPPHGGEEEVEHARHGGGGAGRGGGGGGASCMSRRVMVGVSSDFAVKCSRSSGASRGGGGGGGGGDVVHVSWQRRGPVAESARGSVYVVQVLLLKLRSRNLNACTHHMSA